jgi:hypothetical protein
MNELIINQNEITKSEFDDMVKLKDLEVWSKHQVDSFIVDYGREIEKGEIDDFTSLSEDQKDLFKSFEAEIKSLDKWIVTDYDDELRRINKSIIFTRDKQVDFDLIENEGELLKARSGVYRDTELNRKLDRVGKPFGKSE